MPRPRRIISAIAEETSTPPPELAATQTIAQISKAEGNNLYSCLLPSSQIVILAELSARFRNTIWLKRNGYVLIDMKDANARQNKISGEIINIVRNERLWRKQSYWPKEFGISRAYAEDSDEDDSVVGKLPPSESESE
ncbi:hypothetical protein K3495_g1636 [Podosphaera aphanis]|nr:hypothetical protein K3495_g1636 [Podosphaera aphanis]